MPDAGAGGVAVGVLGQVVAPHCLVALVIEQHRHEGQVCFAGDAETLGHRVIQETAVTHESHHRLIGLGQLDAQGEAQSLTKTSVGLVVTLGPVPAHVPADGAAMGGDFLGITTSSGITSLRTAQSRAGSMGLLALAEASAARVSAR